MSVKQLCHAAPVFDQEKAIKECLVEVNKEICVTSGEGLRYDVAQKVIDLGQWAVECKVHPRFSQRSAATVCETLRELGWTNTSYALKGEKLCLSLAIALEK